MSLPLTAEVLRLREVLLRDVLARGAVARFSSSSVWTFSARFADGTRNSYALPRATTTEPAELHGFVRELADELGVPARTTF